ncbi:MAG: PD-(D/E)XK nuclease family protein [Tunicatimonas sp.]|uniref:PDDEXK-like family protein n=1 Tax=Tunicatimonas sp. TaxID=1940096 RepID=UPI003C791D94
MEIPHILSLVSEVIKQYEQEAKKTGENFNIFRLLRVETKEVQLHSTLIAELLNPQGSHGRGDLFLRMFFSVLSDSAIPTETFKTQLAAVEVEKFVGPITEDAFSGGRIDIVITDECGKRILIENKIDAVDQQNQLVRYKNYDSDAILLYLTLEGNDASINSKGNLTAKKDYFLISYRETIRKWLTACAGEENPPIVQETIRQYRILIEQLTQQSSYDQMNSEIKNTLCQNENSFISAQRICEAYAMLLEEIKREFWEEVKTQCPKDIVLVDNQHRIICDVGEDPPFYFGFKIDKNALLLSDDEFSKLSLIFKGINADFKSSDSYPDFYWLGWIGSRYISSFQELNPTTIYELHNAASRKDFVAKLMDEFREHIKAFESKLHSSRRKVRRI